MTKSEEGKPDLSMEDKRMASTLLANILGAPDAIALAAMELFKLPRASLMPTTRN